MTTTMLLAKNYFSIVVMPCSDYESDFITRIIIHTIRGFMTKEEYVFGKKKSIKKNSELLSNVLSSCISLV